MPCCLLSLLDVVFNLSQKFATASQLPLKGYSRALLVSAIIIGIPLSHY